MHNKKLKVFVRASCVFWILV